MSPQKRKLIPGLLSGLFLATSIVPTFINTNSYAVGSSSYFDWKAEACVIENYNEENGVNVDRIEDVDFEKITTLNCRGRNIENIHGLVLMPNLETLILSNNRNLSYLDLSQNKKLKTLDLEKSNIYFLDLTENKELENFNAATRYYFDAKTIAYVERSDDEDYEYMLDLSKLKFWKDSYYKNDDKHPSKYDKATKTIYFEKDLPYAALTTEAFSIKTRYGNIYYSIYFGDGEKVTNRAFFSDNCREEEKNGDYVYYTCESISVNGDKLDTDEIIKNKLANFFDLESYELSEVKIVPPTANVKLTKNEKTLKQGTILTDADFTLEFYFDIKKPKTPNTGFFTNDDGSVNVSSVLLSLAGVLISIFSVIFFIHRIAKKSRAKRF